MDNVSVYHVLSKKEDYTKIKSEGLQPQWVNILENLEIYEANENIKYPKYYEARLQFEEELDLVSESALPRDLQGRNIKRLDSLFAWPHKAEFQYVLELRVNPNEVYAFNQFWISEFYLSFIRTIIDFSSLDLTIDIPDKFRRKNDVEYWKSGMPLDQLLIIHQYLSDNRFKVNGTDYRAEILIPQYSFKNVEIVGLHEMRKSAR